MRSIALINERIQAGRAVVLTVEEVKARVQDQGIQAVAASVDVVTTGTFEPMVIRCDSEFGADGSTD